MPRSGAGVYSKPSGTTAVQGQIIESADYNTTIDDLVGDANAARPVAAGGTGATNAADARANLSVRHEVASFAALSALVAADVAVGAYVRTPDGLYQRVASGGHLDYSGSGGIRLNVIPANNILPMLALGPAANGITDDAAKINLVNIAGSVVDLGGKDYEFGGTFAATATFVNGRIIDDNRTHDFRLKTNETAPTVGQARGRINYESATAVRVDGIPDKIAMGGFRFMGQYLKSQGRLLSTGLGSASHAIVDMASQLSGLITSELDNWYAVFACANSTSAAVSFRLVPFFRCLSRAGNVITLGHGGENQNVSPVAQTYDVAANAFAGTDCLVIQQGGVFAGRVTTITANTTTTITLADGSGISALDFLLPAPPGFSDYHYLGSGYFEAPGEWRNIADGGSEVNARMVTVAELPASGALANSKIRLGGNITPLATGFMGRLIESLSTSSTGAISETISHDSSNHDIFQMYEEKTSTATFTILKMIDGLCFSKEQAFWITTTGGLAAAVSGRSILCHGWVEP